MSVNGKEAPYSVLNPSQQSTMDAVDANLRVVIPTAIFTQAESIVADSRVKYPGDSYLMWGKRLSEKQKKAAADLYRENKHMTTDELGRQFHYSGETMRHVLIEQGVILRDTGPEKGYEIIKLPTPKLITRYERKGKEHKGSTALAKEFNTSVHTVLNRLRKAGVAILPSGGNMPLDLPDDEMAVEYNNGTAYAKIAKKRNTTAPTVRNHLKNNSNVISRRRGPSSKDGT